MRVGLGLRFSVVVGLLLSAGSASSAGLVEVPPFVGDLTEDWESFPSPPGEEPLLLPNPTTIMSGGATISAPLMSIYEPGAHDFGLGTSGVAQVADGVQGMGINAFSATGSIEFMTPVTRFGSFWGAATSTHPAQNIGDPAIFDVRFFDEIGSLITNVSFEYSRSLPGGLPGDGFLEWHGWTSDVPITRIEFSEDGMVMDGLQATLIPEPSSLMHLAVVAPALVIWIRTRKCRQGRITKRHVLN